MKPSHPSSRLGRRSQRAPPAASSANPFAARRRSVRGAFPCAATILRGPVQLGLEPAIALLDHLGGDAPPLEVVADQRVTRAPRRERRRHASRAKRASSTSPARVTVSSAASPVGRSDASSAASRPRSDAACDRPGSAPTARRACASTRRSSARSLRARSRSSATPMSSPAASTGSAGNTRQGLAVELDRDATAPGLPECRDDRCHTLFVSAAFMSAVRVQRRAPGSVSGLGADRLVLRVGLDGLLRLLDGGDLHRGAAGLGQQPSPTRPARAVPRPGCGRGSPAPCRGSRSGTQSRSGDPARAARHRS